MDRSVRRPVSLAGLSLISAGAVLGLALSTPAQASPEDSTRAPRGNSAPAADKERPGH